MIPAIGVMIAAYIITRMVEIFGRSDRGTGLKVVAGITIVIVIFSVIDLMNLSSSTPGLR